ncbi:MAG: helix-turn-helix domain-containing protein [Nitrospirales bacterium]
MITPICINILALPDRRRRRRDDDHCEGRERMNETPLADALEAIEQALATAPASALPALLGTLEKFKALGWGRMLTGTHDGQGTMTLTQLLTPEQVADRLAVDESLVYEMAREGKLPSLKLGKYRRFDEAAVQAYIESLEG